jgi:hypothetical protein
MKLQEKIKSSAMAIANAQDLTNKEKSQQLEKLYKKGRPKKTSKMYVIAKKGIQGGRVKGSRIKLVDKRMKKDKRGAAASNKNKGRKRKR